VPICFDRRFGNTHRSQQLGQRKTLTMSARDRQLAVLYWQLQKRVHTDPAMRSYLSALTRILKKRRIRPTVLNQVGLDLVVQEQI
jgi:hypothetical protein